MSHFTKTHKKQEKAPTQQQKLILSEGTFSIKIGLRRRVEPKKMNRTVKVFFLFFFQFFFVFLFQKNSADIEEKSGDDDDEMS